MERYRDFLAARRELLAAAANEFLAELRDGHEPVPEPLGRLTVSTDYEAEDERVARVKSVVDELVSAGCATPAFDSEIADPATGSVLAVAEAYWPDELQPGIGRPVVLELDQDGAHLPRLEELGYEVFTSLEALRGFVRRRNEEAAGLRALTEDVEGWTA